MFGRWFLQQFIFQYLPFLFSEKSACGSFQDSNVTVASRGENSKFVVFFFAAEQRLKRWQGRQLSWLSASKRAMRWWDAPLPCSPSAARCFPRDIEHSWVCLRWFVIFPMDKSPFGSLWIPLVSPQDVFFLCGEPPKQIWVLADLHEISQDWWSQERLQKTYRFFLPLSQTQQQGALVKKHSSLIKSKKIERQCSPIK